jgi:hypothetical protein
MTDCDSASCQSPARRGLVLSQRDNTDLADGMCAPNLDLRISPAFNAGRRFLILAAHKMGLPTW